MSKPSIRDGAAQPPAVVSRMFVHPRGLLGRIGAKAMLRSNEPAYRWIAEILDLGPSERFLDVGCGPGGLLRVMRETGAEVVGVDPSPDMVRLVSRDGIEAHCAPAERLPLENDSFTAACAMHTIDFWESRIDGLTELRRVLHPTGRLSIVVRNLNLDARPWHPSRQGFSDAQLDALQNQLESAGFSSTRRDDVTLNGEQLVSLTSATS